MYCGDKADTREHCPSKSIFEQAISTDFADSITCKQCNNGFSADEIYKRILTICTNTMEIYRYIFVRALKLEERVLMQRRAVERTLVQTPCGDETNAYFTKVK